MAIDPVEDIAAERRQQAHKARDAWWKIVAGLFGMPVVDGTDMLHRPPWATWSLTVLVSLVSGLAFFNLTHWVEVFALIPSQAGRYVGLTFITSFFLHAGLFHLAANMYFLLIFGDNVEQTLGVGRYLLLIFLAAVVGAAAHAALDPSRNVPVIGASGGIAGIVAFYACRFPKVSLRFLVLFKWFTIPVWSFFVFWIAMQGLGVVTELFGRSGVSSLSHVGGAAVGVLFYLERRMISEREA